MKKYYYYTCVMTYRVENPIVMWRIFKTKQYSTETEMVPIDWRVMIKYIGKPDEWAKIWLKKNHPDVKYDKLVAAFFKSHGSFKAIKEELKKGGEDVADFDKIVKEIKENEG